MAQITFAQQAKRWPKEKLLRHPPELPMAERVRRYQHNVRTIRAAKCRVPTTAMPDTLDAVEIEAWFAVGAERSRRLGEIIVKLNDHMLTHGNAW